MKGRIGTCVYCGNTRRLTKDHVPPKALWTPPRPSDLVRVPACGECNGAASKDDEYFKMMLVMKAGSGEHPEIKALGPSVMRALAKPEKVGLRRHLQKSIQLEDLRSKAGLYLGRVPVMDVNLQRLDRAQRHLIRKSPALLVGNSLTIDVERDLGMFPERVKAAVRVGSDSRSA